MHFTLSTSLVTFAVLAAAASPAGQGNGMTIPIVKRSSLLNADKSVNLDALNSHVASVKAKVLRGLETFEKNIGTAHPSAVKTAEKRGAGVSLIDHDSELWYGSISVGTPPKNLIVDFDTGSSDLFLLPEWHPKSSSTSDDLGKNFTLEYGDGAAVSGEQYTDTVSIAGFTAREQTLGAVLKYSSRLQKSQFPPDGLLGMGYQSISAYNASPVFQSLLSQGEVTDACFSFKLSSSGSELYIGGANHDLYTGDFTFTPVTHQGYWQVMMDSVQSNGRTILSNIDSIIDTGTTLVIGHPDPVSALYSAIGGRSIGDGYYAFDCNSFPTISLGFGHGGKSFPILASALNLGPVSNGSSQCVSGLVSANIGVSSWIIGDVFLQGVYTVFDYGNSQVGFAQLA